MGAGNPLVAAFSEVQNCRYYGRRGRGPQGEKGGNRQSVAGIQTRALNTPQPSPVAWPKRWAVPLSGSTLRKTDAGMPGRTREDHATRCGQSKAADNRIARLYHNLARAGATSPLASQTLLRGNAHQRARRQSLKHGPKSTPCCQGRLQLGHGQRTRLHRNLAQNNNRRRGCEGQVERQDYRPLPMASICPSMACQ